MSLRTRYNGFSDSKYKNIVAEFLSKEELISIYNENKKSLIENGFCNTSIESNFISVINNLIYKDIEITKIIIQDLIDLNICYFNLHEIIEISTCRFATREETQNIFSNQRIFNWFFREFRNSYNYIAYKDKINNWKYYDRIFKSINNLLWFFVEIEDNDKFYQALYNHLYQLPINEKEAFFNSFSYGSKQLINETQKEIVATFIKGLSNEKSLRNLFHIANNTVDDIVRQLEILNYDLDKHYREIEIILNELRQRDEKAFIDNLIILIEKKNNSDYYLSQYFRAINKMDIVLKYRKLRYSICANYSLDIDFLPIERRKKVDINELNEVSYIIKEMIDINCKFQLFNPVKFFDPMGGFFYFDKKIQNIIMQNLYDFAYNKNLRIEILLKVILYYKIDIDKLAFKKDIDQERMEFYNDLNATCKYLMKIFINPSLDSYIANGLSLERMRMAMHLLSINCPIELLELVLSETAGTPNDKGKTLMHLFFHILIERNIENFEPVANYIIDKNLTEEIVQCFDIDILTKYVPRGEDQKSIVFFNSDYIYIVKNYLHSYVARMSATSKHTYTLSFFEKLLEKINVVKEGDPMFEVYIGTIKYPCIYEDLDTDALINEIKTDLAKINIGE